MNDEELIAEMRAWAEDDILPGDVQVLLLKAAIALTGEEPKYEYAWMGDAQSENQYWSYAEALEYLGDPKYFRRLKAGPWEEYK